MRTLWHGFCRENLTGKIMGTGKTNWNDNLNLNRNWNDNLNGSVDINDMLYREALRML